VDIPAEVEGIPVEVEGIRAEAGDIRAEGNREDRGAVKNKTDLHRRMTLSS
jgi:hypothetical protein